jgi:WD40-like Beta Propeller Repeat
MTGASFITPNFLLPYSSQASDYRCAVNAAGAAVVFERTVFKSAGGSGKSQLYLLDLTQSGATPTLFLQDQSIEISDRPDWSWVTGDVAFNFGPDIWVGVVDSGGANFRSLGAQTARMNYPTWFPHGQALAVENDAPIPGTTYPLPNTTKIDSSTGVIIKGDLEGLALWGGMPSVNPVNPHLIAFAGQPVAQAPQYNQDFNCIWVMDTSSGAAPVLLEKGARIEPYDPRFQGRAPWWSPDGKWVVFESNRPTQPLAEVGAGLYAIFLYEHGGSNPAIQITDIVYNCNHSKWFPNGFPGRPPGPFQLIVAAWQPDGSGSAAPPYGLASLDLTSLGIAF